MILNSWHILSSHYMCLGNEDMFLCFIPGIQDCQHNSVQLLSHQHSVNTVANKYWLPSFPGHTQYIYISPL